MPVTPPDGSRFGASSFSASVGAPASAAQQGASGLALLNQQLAAQVSNGGPTRWHRYVVKAFLNPKLWMCYCGGMQCGRTAAQAPDAVAWCLSDTKGEASVPLLQGSRLHMDERGALWLLPAAAAASMAASAAPSAAAPEQSAPFVGHAAAPAPAGVPQSIGTAAAIIENGGLPAQAQQVPTNLLH